MESGMWYHLLVSTGYVFYPNCMQRSLIPFENKVGGSAI
jgi:hypothetical protein